MFQHVHPCSSGRSVTRSPPSIPVLCTVAAAVAAVVATESIRLLRLLLPLLLPLLLLLPPLHNGRQLCRRTPRRCPAFPPLPGSPSSSSASGGRATRPKFPWPTPLAVGSANTARCKPSKFSVSFKRDPAPRAAAVLPTLTTFMLSRPLSESVSCRTFANEHSASTRASSSIAARRAPRVRNLQTSRDISDLPGQAKSPFGPEIGLSPVIAKASWSSYARVRGRRPRCDARDAATSPHPHP